ncbi:MAG: hypothetical protein ACTHLE_01585 [Agriterribacter sp.]
MKKIKFPSMLLGALLVSASAAFSQSKIKDGTVTSSSNLPHADAVAEFESNNKGVLLPRVALTATNSAAPLTNHVAGMMVYNTATAGTAPNNVTPGFYYNTGSGWARAMDYASFKPVLLSGGDAADAITATTTVSTANGSTTNSRKSVATRQFTLDRESLVTISYHIGVGSITQNDGSGITDGTAKRYGVELSFSQVPSSSLLAANQVFARSRSSYTNYPSGGIFGSFFLTGSPQLKLSAGTYTLNIEGEVRANSSDSQGIKAEFGPDSMDRIDITAAAL